MKRIMLVYLIGWLLSAQFVAAQDIGHEVPDTAKKQSGFEVKLDAGYYGGLLINLNLVIYNSGFGLAVYPGYRVNDYFAIYPGVGIERYEDGVLIPFFLDFETYITKNKKGYVDARIGYSTGFNNRSINIQYNFGGGFVIGAAVGTKLYKSDHFRLGLQFGYDFRTAHYTYQPFVNSEQVTSRFDYHFFSGRLTFTLK